MTHYEDIVKLDLAKPDFKFGILNYARIDNEYHDNKKFYYVDAMLFHKHYKAYLQTAVNTDNYHTLIDEANDIVKTWLLQFQTEINDSINII